MAKSWTKVDRWMELWSAALVVACRKPKGPQRNIWVDVAQACRCFAEEAARDA